MKKLFIALLCLLLAGLCACGQEVEEELAPYNAVLRRYKRGVSFGDYGQVYQYYALYDIDGNGSKELFLGLDLWDGSEISFATIYAIKNKNAVRLEPYELWNGSGLLPSLFSNGTILSKHSYDDSGKWLRYYRFEDGALRLQVSLIEDIMFDEYFLHDLNAKENIPITKEEFEQLQKEMEGDGQIVEIDWRPLAGYGAGG
ncbi:MAG: hypothetical protein FWE98_04490 [Oscillospiraceae bacterium]|nr:hypothetical protein [Oscillospiraceae bacterium]